jgi:hypothetical protein
LLDGSQISSKDFKWFEPLSGFLFLVARDTFGTIVWWHHLAWIGSIVFLQAA